MREPRWRRSCGPGPSLSPLGPGSGTGDGQKEEAETLQAQMKPSSPPVCLTLPQCLCCLFSRSLASLSKLYTAPGSTRLEPRAPREFFFSHRGYSFTKQRRKRGHREFVFSYPNPGIGCTIPCSVVWGKFLRRESVVVCLCYSFRFSFDVVGKNVLHVNVFILRVFSCGRSPRPL